MDDYEKRIKAGYKQAEFIEELIKAGYSITPTYFSFCLNKARKDKAITPQNTEGEKQVDDKIEQPAKRKFVFNPNPDPKNLI